MFERDNRAEPVLTAAEMRAAEGRAIAAGTPALTLMERAGEAAPSAIAGYCGPASTLVLAGPGNNGGDGYVAAAALAPPATAEARAAAVAWQGPVETLLTAQPARIVVDALFGTGLARPLSPELQADIRRLADGAIAIALDLPSGAASDDGTPLSPLLPCEMTVAFGALKPAHLLYPAAAAMGRVVVADIGLGAQSTRLVRNARPAPLPLAVDTHKYRRGHVLVVAGAMAGAAWLAARAAQRAGSGYVTLASEAPVPPSSLVVMALADVDVARVGALVLGPGLGRDAAARGRAEAALALTRPSVLDADLFTLFAEAPERLFGRGDVMTPHEGEFARFFGNLPGNKVERARAAAALSGNIIVLKGPDTVIAAPDGKAAINAHSSPRLATAGSGDVLAGMIAARLAAGEAPFDAACAAVFLHGSAALAGFDAMTAEDLVERIG